MAPHYSHNHKRRTQNASRHFPLKLPTLINFLPCLKFCLRKEVDGCRLRRFSVLTKSQRSLQRLSSWATNLMDATSDVGIYRLPSAVICFQSLPLKQWWCCAKKTRYEGKYELLLWKRHATSCFYECLNLLHRYFQPIRGKTCQGTLCSCIISFWWLATNKFLFCHGVGKCPKRNNLRAKIRGKSQKRRKGDLGGEGPTEGRK